QAGLPRRHHRRISRLALQCPPLRQRPGRAPEPRSRHPVRNGSQTRRTPIPHPPIESTKRNEPRNTRNTRKKTKKPSYSDTDRKVNSKRFWLFLSLISCISRLISVPLAAGGW